MRVQSVIDRLGYSPNRAARQLRTRSSHLIGLRFEAAQEGTSNALMDRFLHSLVEAASRTGHHVLLFSGDPEDPLDGYDDLLRSTAVDAFVVTDTYAGTPQAGFLQERGAPVRDLRPPVGRAGGRPRLDRRRRRPRCPARHRAPARAGPPAGRLARLGEDLAHRPGPAQRLGDGDARGRRWTPTGSASGSPTTSTPPGWPPTTCSRTRRSPASPAPATPSAIGVLHACAERGLRPGRRRRRRRLRRLARRAGHLAGPDLGAPAARAGRRRAGADPAPRARPQAARRQGPDAAARARRTPLQPARLSSTRSQYAAAPHVDRVVDRRCPRARPGSPRRPRRRTRCVRRPRGPRASRRSRPCRPGAAPSPASCPEPRHLDGVDVGVAAPEPRRRTSSGSGRCRSRTRGRRGASPGRARPARARSPDRRSRPSARASRRPTRRGSGSAVGRALEDGDVARAGVPDGGRSRRGRRAARRPVTERAVSAKSGRWKPVPQPMSRTSRPAQGPSDCISAVIAPARSTARFSIS